MKKTNRREALKHLALGSIALSTAGTLSCAENMNEAHKADSHRLKGNVNHSVCQWTYNFLSLDELCQLVKKIGFNAIDLIAPKDWPTLKKYGIYSSMCYINGKVSLTDGFNDKKFHEKLIKAYLEVIPLMKNAGYKNLICFSGSRRGM